MHLFYIENEEFLTVVFEVLLKKSEHSIYTTNILESLHLIEDQKPGIILISLNYDFEKITNLISEIKKNPSFSPVLVMLGDEHQVMQMNEEKIFDYYLVKPIAPLEALELLESFLGRP